MKKLALSVFLAALVFGAVAAPAPAASIGVGVIAGEPTGLSVKAWLDERHAVDLGVGWSLTRSAVHIHVDYLWHEFDLLRPGGGSRLPLYFGVGGRFTSGDTGHLAELGVRAPVGVSWIPAKVPLDLFVEVAPVLNLFPDSALSVSAAIGLRYWLR